MGSEDLASARQSRHQGMRLGLAVRPLTFAEQQRAHTRGSQRIFVAANVRH
jgi:hypothetical protein